MTTESEQGRLGLDESCGAGETLYADDFGQHEASRRDLVRELLRAMDAVHPRPRRCVALLMTRLS